ncbi:MAG: hypothetical protein PHU53_06880, partial [Thermoplasmata archaeon]|nr:hypothetical protein [Thermoplasmata archaeon]
MALFKKKKKEDEEPGQGFDEGIGMTGALAETKKEGFFSKKKETGHAEPPHVETTRAEPAVAPIEKTDEDGSIVCPICGSPSPPGTTVCGTCGGSLGKEPEPDIEPEPEPEQIKPELPEEVIVREPEPEIELVRVPEPPKPQKAWV